MFNLKIMGDFCCKLDNEVDEQLTCCHQGKCNIYHQDFKPDIIPENYLENLFSFLKENQYTDDTTDFKEMIFSMKGNPMFTNIEVICQFYYFLNDDWDEMEKNYEITSFKKEIPIGNDSDSDEEDDVMIALHQMKNQITNSNSVYSKTKKGILFVLSCPYGNFPIFIDDVALKFKLEVPGTDKVFNTDTYV